MVAPIVVPRDGHPISRKDIDPDALKVLYRLRHFDHIAYLVGGSVRDLIIGRRPKDFDIGTSAHPYEVKRLFRNCWIIGRRFRLAHVKFGNKAIEVATFRRQVPAGSEGEAAGPPPASADPGAAGSKAERDHFIHRDNTFGTPEEDAFRRDFTVNALFYDIATFSIIDYVGGLDDIRSGLIRCIGEPDERFEEDPVRMLRAVALAARLDFRIDPPILDAMRRHRTAIARSAAPRLLEEFYKILRGGSAERAFRGLAEHGLLEPIAPDLDRRAIEPLWRSLALLDAYRRRFDGIPDTLTNPILLGSLLVPAGLLSPHAGRGQVPRTSLGTLTLARRDIEQLNQILTLQRRLLDPGLPARTRRALKMRGAFQEALTWLEIHGGAPEAVQQWRAFLAEAPEGGVPQAADAPRRRFRRRRRGRRRSAGPHGG